MRALSARATLLAQPRHGAVTICSHTALTLAGRFGCVEAGCGRCNHGSPRDPAGPERRHKLDINGWSCKKSPAHSVEQLLKSIRTRRFVTSARRIYARCSPRTRRHAISTSVPATWLQPGNWTKLSPKSTAAFPTRTIPICVSWAPSWPSVWVTTPRCAATSRPFPWMTCCARKGSG